MDNELYYTGHLTYRELEAPLFSLGSIILIYYIGLCIMYHMIQETQETQGISIISVEVPQKTDPTSSPLPFHILRCFLGDSLRGLSYSGYAVYGKVSCDDDVSSR